MNTNIGMAGLNICYSVNCGNGNDLKQLPYSLRTNSFESARLNRYIAVCVWMKTVRRESDIYIHVKRKM